MKSAARILALALLCITAVIIVYKALVLKYPVIPAAPVTVWELVFQATLEGERQNLRLPVLLPFNSRGQMVTEEQITSGGLAFSLVQEGGEKVGIWSGSTGQDPVTVSYRAKVVIRPDRPRGLTEPPLHPFPSSMSGEDQGIARAVAEAWTGVGAPERLRLIAGSLAPDGASKGRDLPAGTAWEAFLRRNGGLGAALALMRAAAIPARPLFGLPLVDFVGNAPRQVIDAWTGAGWERLDVASGDVTRDAPPLLRLAIAGAPSSAEGATGAVEQRWTLQHRVINQWGLRYPGLSQTGSLLDRFSLFLLPEDFQDTFRILLLVPLGALMICVLRNLLGFPSFGIFMPVLMALAFRNTGLFYGLLIFAAVILIGYLVRKQIDRLRLLLVPRLSVVLTLVIICFTILAISGGRLGIRQFMAVGLLPIVILTMTIERFFVTMEESGAREAFRTALGSAAVATITYFIINWEALQLTFFVYPELLLAIAAVEILLGRYTGYRLLELARFRSMTTS